MNPPLRQWRRRGFWLSLFALAGLMILGVVGSKLASMRGVNRQIEAIRAQGLPATAKELDAWYEHVPPAENLALAILEAHGEYVTAPEDRDPDAMYSWRDIRKGEKLPPELLAAAGDWVGKNKETIELLHTAARLEKSRYPADLSQTNVFNSTKLLRIKGMTRLLRWDALLKAENGDAEGARASVGAGFALIASLKDEPTLISSLVRIALSASQIQTVEQVLNRVPFSDAALAEVASLAQQAEEDGKHALYRAMVGER